MITADAVYSDRVAIGAPAKLVWEILLDFDRYPEWNRFCPRLENHSLEIGSAVDMMVDLGNGPSRQVEYISRIDPGRCIAWRMPNRVDDPVHAVRSQYIEPQDEQSCIYWTVDEFSGPAMTVMMEQLAAAVEAGFNRCAYDLKERAERLCQLRQRET
ncbi:SRPBCC domain-containing protein [Seongchinamella sediminis]|uniref:SRPBCC domain-containing protein n=1 Tax=Seongchinamella sediminis TaxID=2283635 RepID=A0A3L7DS70_9GAMM|nr:SRPBCC domain-containing protein [Seongchinamella sediminis]RLQ20348.1 SRPBCC domain-containing protein [Seongchinamella sediminis]